MLNSQYFIVKGSPIINWELSRLIKLTTLVPTLEVGGIIQVSLESETNVAGITAKYPNSQAIFVNFSIR